MVLLVSAQLTWAEEPNRSIVTIWTKSAVKKEGFNFKSTQQILKMYVKWFRISSRCAPGRKGAEHWQKRGRGFNKQGERTGEKRTPLRYTNWPILTSSNVIYELIIHKALWFIQQTSGLNSCEPVNTHPVRAKVQESGPGTRPSSKNNSPRRIWTTEHHHNSASTSATTTHL